MYLKSVLFVLFLFTTLLSFGQTDTLKTPPINPLKADTAKKVRKPLTQPQKAALLSATIPGGGQVYNKKYWKLPIIYGAGGVLFYLYRIEQTNLNVYKRAFLYKKAGLSLDNDYFLEFNLKTSNRTGQNTVLENYSLQQLSTLKAKARSTRDTYVLGLVGIYLLSILDASVDAHLKEFDLGDDISMKVEPVFFAGGVPSASIGINFRLK
jgi:hypothetical protein